MTLNFEVRVNDLNDRLAERQWQGIARRIAKAAKGRSPNREAQVWATDYKAQKTTNVFCGGDGAIEVRQTKG